MRVAGYITKLILDSPSSKSESSAQNSPTLTEFEIRRGPGDRFEKVQPFLKPKSPGCPDCARKSSKIADGIKRGGAKWVCGGLKDCARVWKIV